MILYDFTDPDDYASGADDHQSQAGGGSDNGKLWKRDSKKSREGKLPCVRLLSSKRKIAEGSAEAVGGVGAAGGSEEKEEWAESPTVSVLLESMGKVYMYGQQR